MSGAATPFGRRGAVGDAAPWGPSGGNQPQSGAPHREPFSFTGTAAEYFGIWIVNILLTIVTLGIYSAWAKVRRLRYFYGNTHLAGASFDYHARPVQILVGRIIVLLLLAAYNVSGFLFPTISLLLIPIFVLIMPWFIYRGIRFSARVTSYRNIRFDFKGGYGGAMLAYMVGPFLALLSFGVLIPLASRWSWRYQFDNLTYGDRPVTSDPRLGAFYRQWALPAALVALLAIVVPILLSSVVSLIYSDVQQTSAIQSVHGSARAATALAPTYDIAQAQTEEQPPISQDFGLDDLAEEPWFYFLLMALDFVLMLLPVVLLIYALFYYYYQAGARNVAFNATVIDARHQLVSNVGRLRYLWIMVSNTIATLLSLGLARPWAAVRLAKYLAATTALDVSGRLDDFIGSVKESTGVTGSEFMDFEGFDLGF